MASLFVKALRLASIAICLIVGCSFLLFAVNQTSTASGHQQELVSGQPSVQSPAQSPAGKHESGLRKGVDDAAEELTSPVAGLTSSASEWGGHAIRLAFALLVYGFGLGYLARALRVRA
jgi:hypothetical protein